LAVERTKAGARLARPLLLTSSGKRAADFWQGLPPHSQEPKGVLAPRTAG
jgi:hypothetical protein